VLLAYFVYGPALAAGTEAAQRSDLFIGVCLGIWMFAELSNLATHVTLRNLRPAGTRVRRIPRGYGFGLVSCPNYLFEIIAWIAYSVLVGNWAAWLFTLAGAATMYTWAVKKHRNYRREFKDYPRGRKALIPFLV